jgi:hypothetical protein
MKSRKEMRIPACSFSFALLLSLLNAPGIEAQSSQPAIQRLFGFAAIQAPKLAQTAKIPIG